MGFGIVVTGQYKRKFFLYSWASLSVSVTIAAAFLAASRLEIFLYGTPGFW
ncbi:hypothetical protein KIM372_17700 [Bombiscardovia nodaiensis]|uniref:Uncharacterized protein n=1 Tax=Bombiscardovia nodaiensis TaxID=2932181 RepID=A0ABN6SEE2_9BIFI|nr:hypothetical protein KIM372_17700 [Bombiscardovia nodaiensis]